jgi:hypothetical protein
MTDQNQKKTWPQQGQSTKTDNTANKTGFNQDQRQKQGFNKDQQAPRNTPTQGGLDKTMSGGASKGSFGNKDFQKDKNQKK